MTKTFQYKYRLSLALLTLIIFLGLFYNISNSNAQGQEFSVELPNQYPILEYTDKFGQNINTKIVNISLPLSTWNITDIALNFTDIKLFQEIKTIEDNPINYLSISKFRHCLAVQINITEPTTLFATQIYIANYSSIYTKIYIQLNQYNSITQKPSNIIPETQIELNISSTTTPNWYTQKFPSPIELPIGTYCLVLNGTNIGTAPQPYYRWFNNIENSTYPDLFIWEYSTGVWGTGQENRTFLYKLVQRVNRSYNPEDINMTIRVNEDNYPITNGTEVGTGKVNINDINFNPNSDLLSLTVQNSQSLDLYYNISFYAKYKNSFFSSGQVKIEEDSSNKWQINPQINRVFNNYSIEFIYPKSWFNLTVFRDGENKTAEIIFSDNSLKILDSSILPGSTWLITANSPNIDIDLNFPYTSWKTGQELEFSLEEPVIPGTYTFKLYNSLGERFNLHLNSLKLLWFLQDLHLIQYLLL
jgi:hypothetical protein